MEKIIDIEKQSKKSKRDYYVKFRRNWFGLNPVTKKSKIKTRYNRNAKIIDKGE